MKFRYFSLLAGGLASFIMSSAALASTQSVIPSGDFPKLNKINYQISAEQWVETKTANVTVGVDASLNQQGLDGLQAQVEKNLKSLANVDWRIVDFSRNEDQSGLESVHITAQARVPSNQVVTMRSSADSLSKPGIKYQIANIEYQPTQDDVQAAQANLRAQIYQKIAQEISQLDKTFGNQDFYVHALAFTTGDQPMPVASNGMAMKTMMLATAPNAGSGTSVSQKITLTADVVVASTIEWPGN